MSFVFKMMSFVLKRMMHFGATSWTKGAAGTALCAPRAALHPQLTLDLSLGLPQLTLPQLTLDLALRLSLGQ